MYKIENVKTGQFLSGWSGREPSWGKDRITLYPSYGVALNHVVRLSELGFCVHIRPAGNQTAELNPARAQ